MLYTAQTCLNIKMKHVLNVAFLFAVWPECILSKQLASVNRPGKTEARRAMICTLLKAGSHSLHLLCQAFQAARHDGI